MPSSDKNSKPQFAQYMTWAELIKNIGGGRGAESLRKIVGALIKSFGTANAEFWESYR